MPRKRIPSNNECYSKPFPSNLRKLMEETSTTQQVLADALGVQRQTISYYCDGSSSPNWEGIANISKFFSVSTDWLLGLSDVRSTQADLRSACDFTGLSENSVNSILEATARQNTKLALEFILSSDNKKFINLLEAAYRSLPGTGVASTLKSGISEEATEALERLYGIYLDPNELKQISATRAGNILSDILNAANRTLTIELRMKNESCDELKSKLEDYLHGLD